MNEGTLPGIYQCEVFVASTRHPVIVRNVISVLLYGSRTWRMNYSRKLPVAFVVFTDYGG